MTRKSLHRRFWEQCRNRKDLAIYKIENSTNSSKILFNYQNQKEFKTNYLNHNFDAEAMIFLDGNIHLFTKEWSLKIFHYIVNLQNAENQPIIKIESYKTGFVVTDASYFEGKLYVVGYTKKGKSFYDDFEENSDGLFFFQTIKKYKLGSALTIGQVEGIAVNKDGIYISNESFVHLFSKVKQKFVFYSFSSIKIIFFYC